MDIKQVTVFGGSGFVGRAIVRALAPQGYQIRVACRRPELAEPIRTAGDVGQIVAVRTNLRMPASVAAAIAGSQAVINAAGIPFQRGRQRYQAVHVEGARAIAEAARAAGVSRLVHVSGLGADDRSARNPFIRSKVDAEDAIIAGFPDATILRPSVVFGGSGFVGKAIVRALAPQGYQIRIACRRPELAEPIRTAAAAVLARPDTARCVFELGGPRVYTYRELAALVLREIDRDKPIIGIPAGLMKLAGWFAEFTPVPPLTHDQVDLLVEDNVVRGGAKTLADLGIVPTAAESILPTYLDRFRVGGRYNQHAPA